MPVPAAPPLGPPSFQGTPPRSLAFVLWNASNAPESPSHQRSSSASRTMRERTPEARWISASSVAASLPCGAVEKRKAMPSWRPTIFNASCSAGSSAPSAARGALRTLSRSSRACSSLSRRCCAWVRWRFARSTSVRRRFISSAESDRRWNSAKAASSRPSACNACVDRTVAWAGGNRRSQLCAVTGTVSGPSKCGPLASKNVAAPALTVTQATPWRVDTTLSASIVRSSPTLKMRCGRGRGMSRAIAAAISVTQASTCSTSSSARSASLRERRQAHTEQLGVGQRLADERRRRFAIAGWRPEDQPLAAGAQHLLEVRRRFASTRIRPETHRPRPWRRTTPCPGRSGGWGGCRRRRTARWPAR